MENADVWSFKSPNNYLGVNEMSNMNDSVDNGNAGGDLAKKSISRRDMLKLVGVLGISGTVLGELLTSCGGSSPAADTMATDTVADLAAFDPMKYAGQTVRIMMTGDENDHRALGDQIAALEAETGIKVEITSPALGALIEKTLQNLKADTSSFEIIEYLGFLTTQQVGAGYYEQLNQYIDDPAETAPDWDVADFLEPAMKIVAYFDIAAGQVGQGTDIYGLPGLHSGSVIYFYRKDLFEAAGLQPAKTWQEFHDAAKVLNTADVAGCSFIGANDFSLATVDWFTRFITTGGKLMSGSPQTKDFKPNVNSAEGIGALQLLIDVLPYAPKNVTTYGFAENVDGFSTGKIAQMIFWSTIAGPIFDPAKSTVSDKVGTSTVPANAGETPRSILGGWGTGIPKNADPALKGAAWRALQWMTSKSFNNYSAKAYQIDASRTSTYEDPELVAQLPYLPDALAAMQTAEMIQTSLIGEFFSMNDAMNVEFNAALLGSQSAKQACDKVQAKWEEILRTAGHLV